jgi:hypothetical protein
MQFQQMSLPLFLPLVSGFSELGQVPGQELGQVPGQALGQVLGRVLGRVFV